MESELSDEETVFLNLKESPKEASLEKPNFTKANLEEKYEIGVIECKESDLAIKDGKNFI